MDLTITPAPKRHTDLILDVIERVVVIGLFVSLCLNLGRDFLRHGHLVSLLFVIGESIPVALVLVRRPAQPLSQRPRDWFLTLIGTCLPLLVRASGPAVMAPVICGLIILLGFAIQVAAKISLGRSFGLVPAIRGVKNGGLYRLVRHPIYAGYVLMDLGFLLANAGAWNMALYIIAYSAQLGRLFAEEQLLMEDANYRAYAARTHWRIVPGVF
jgi:protein-S-isoprenylcysteine O-methyltransferase Ste14